MKSIINKISIMVLGVAILASCTDNFEEINENPNAALSVPSSLYIPTLAENTGDRLYSMFWGGDMGGNWAQHWSKVQYNDEEMYQPRNTVIETTIWEGLYAGTLQDAKNMYETAVTEENDKTKGVALIWHAYGFSILTDMFGDIPYTEALSAKEGINAPAYDLQSEIYPALVDSLSAAVTYLNGGGTIDATADIIYGGDAMGWIKFANSLKFRLLMRMSGQVDVSSQLTALMSQPMFTSNADHAAIPYLETNPNTNPLWNTVVFGVREEHRMSATLIDELVNLSDPRLSVYAEVNADGEYRGKPNGINSVPNDDYNYTNVSGIGEYYLQPDLPGLFMSYDELQFFKAEAAAKGFIGGSPADFYNSAITANFEWNGIGTSAPAYLALHPYSDVEGIHLQKWIALYGQGVEAWTEWRRTQVPTLTPAIDGVVNEVPSRLNYPAAEQSLNSGNYSSAVSRQGADVLTTPIWWMN
ncbi:SusD/RagB family nutrient-binding outer membrane lipoprotein [Marivirga salinae]|uniref:SusD/RagB family nutrient-binding outer membrane lipoprotein n=1 Tax=Marivirga salinarum TaxID=3059078 RepID=A0AA49GHS1_9BACT|nr:SusD/RagB family nutrient-binding outer membrane lipoprotein [Marivirga sp. BDSF4-3]WKK78366.2 SusD/RagB family nutrient-binding outer membrane lipoprotein [Marivirga sp. BDSF4-3]